jgi:5'-nucleotidase
LDVDFSTAATFTQKFASLLLKNQLPKGVDLIKVDVPANATPTTAWEWTKLSRQRYYIPTKPDRKDLSLPNRIGYKLELDLTNEPEDTDVFVLMKKGIVSVTPLTLDMTALVSREELARFLVD